MSLIDFLDWGVPLVMFAMIYLLGYYHGSR